MQFSRDGCCATFAEQPHARFFHSVFGGSGNPWARAAVRKCILAICEMLGRTMLFHERPSHGVHGGGSALGQGEHASLSHLREARDEFMARENRGRRHGEILFGLVALHEFDLPAKRQQRLGHHVLARPMRRGQVRTRPAC